MTSTRIEDYDPSSLRFSSNYEDFESIRHPEDGELMIGSYYFVEAEAPNGVRWRRTIGISDWMVGDAPDEEGCYEPFVYRTEDANELNNKAAILASRLEKSPSPRLNPKVWEYAGACYGSPAYVSLGLEEIQIWREENYVF